MTDTPVFDRLPDLNSLVAISGDAQSQVGGVVDMLGSFGDMLPTDIMETFSSLESITSIDVTDLKDMFPQIMEQVQKLLPPELQPKLDMAITGYNTLNDLLERADEVPPTALIQEMATVLLQQLLDLIKAELGNWAGDKVSPEQLETIQTVIVKVESLQGSFPTTSSEVLPFISQNFLPISPEMFTDPMNHLDEILGVVNLLDPSQLGIETAVPSSLGDVFTELTTTIGNLQAAAEAEVDDAVQMVEQALDTVDSALQTIEGALDTAETTVQSGFDQMMTTVGEYNWDLIFTKYEELLVALTLPEVFSFEDLQARLETFLNSLDITFAVEDLNTRLQALQDQVLGAFETSPLQDFRTQLLNTLQTVQTTIEGIPTEELNNLIDQAFEEVQAQMNRLHLNEIKARIEQGLQMIEDFITQNINDVMKNKIESAVNQALSVLDNFHLQDLLDQLGLDQLIENQIMPLFDEVQATLDQYTGQLQDMISRLDTISFKPIGDTVVGEIQGVQTKLKAINPNALSSAEKMAIKGAVTIIENIDLDSIIAEQIKGVYHMAEGEVKGLLGKVADLLNMLWEKINEFGPDRLLVPINDALDTAIKLIDKVSADIVFDPLYEQVGKLLGFLENLSPEQLLDPLQGPYNMLMDAVGSFDPGQWLEPVQAIYDQVVEMIGKLDPTPLFDELAAQQTQFFADIKALILNGYDSAGMPGFLSARLRPIVAGMADAVLGDPNAPWEPVELNLIAELSPGVLFAPLDNAFDQLIELIQQAPLNDFVNTLNRVGEILGMLAPAYLVDRLRELQDKFFNLLPDSSVFDIGLPFDMNLLSDTLDDFVEKASAVPLPADKTEGITTRISQLADRFRAIIARIDPSSPTSLLSTLKGMYDELIAALRGKIDNLDISSATTAYDNLMSSVTTLLPMFLRDLASLTVESFLAGLQTMRPSALLSSVGSTLNRLIDQVRPLQDTFQTGLNALLQKVREVIGLINPLSLRGPIETIFDTIMAKIPSINLTEIANRLKAMLFAPLEDLNPAGIKPALAAAYDNIVGLINSSIFGLLDTIRNAIDAKLEETRVTIKAVVERVRGIIQRAGDLLKNLLDTLKNLVFNEILGRVEKLIDKLGVSFDTEVDRVAAAFRNMLRAIPV